MRGGCGLRVRGGCGSWIRGGCGLRVREGGWPEGCGWVWPLSLKNGLHGGKLTRLKHASERCVVRIQNECVVLF